MAEGIALSGMYRVIPGSILDRAIGHFCVSLSTIDKLVGSLELLSRVSVLYTNESIRREL